MSGTDSPRVLVVDDDADVGDFIAAVLLEEGYRVETISDVSPESFRTALGQIEPDLILLDGAGRHEYGDGWVQAARVHDRLRPIPIIMLTGHSKDAHEAEEGDSTRAQAAAFSDILLKPFDLDTLLEAVSKAVSHEPFNHSATGEQLRTTTLIEKLRTIGASDIQPSSRREWATFRLSPDGLVYQLNWWQSKAQYLLGVYSNDGVFERLGSFWELADALAACEERRKSADPNEGVAPPA